MFIIVAVMVALDVVFLIIVSVDIWRLRLTRKLVIREVTKAMHAIYTHVTLLRYGRLHNIHAHVAE